MKRWRNYSEKNTPEFHDNVWRDYALKSEVRYDAGRPAELARAAKGGDSVCELGCGMYGAAQWLAENTNFTIEIHAVDFSPFVVGWLRNSCHDSRLTVHLCDARETPFLDEQFDLVIAGELIEHMEKPEELVAEMARICKFGGRMMISTVNMHCDDAKRNRMLYPDHVWDFTKRDLVGLFSSYGAAEYWYFGNYHMTECIKS